VLLCCVALLWTVVLIGTACAVEPAGPVITAQGFDIAEVQRRHAGDTDRVRIRFEVPDRISRLHVQERSYEVDLATTPETKHFHLFGIQRPVRQLTDVTLDFLPYINEKLDRAGNYHFELRVVDRKGRSASATLLIGLVEDLAAVPEASSEPTTSNSFEFTRAGANDVSGAEAIGITWKTIESNRVVIQVAVRDRFIGHLFEVDTPGYGAVKNRAQLLKLAEEGREVPNLQLAAASNGAAGKVFGVFRDQVPMLLKITASDTSLSDVGTTVRLQGEYKY